MIDSKEMITNSRKGQRNIHQGIGDNGHGLTKDLVAATLTHKELNQDVLIRNVKRIATDILGLSAGC